MRLLTGIALVSLLALSGCRPPESASPAPTAGAARAALAAMIQNSQDPRLVQTLDPLQRARTEVRGQWVHFGPWRCDLAARRFVISGGGMDDFIEYAGEFVRAADGAWQAQFTGESRAHAR